MVIRLFAAACLFVPTVAMGQEAMNAVAAPEPIKPSHFAIIGLAPNDMLNIRAQASATGMMIGRLPAGAVVVNLGCAVVKKHRWCKIADTNNQKLQGWAAERYLSAIDMEAGPAPTENPDDTYVDPAEIDVLGE